MFNKIPFLLLTVLLVISCQPGNDHSDPQVPNYPTSRAPLREMPYLELPLGVIRPEGWLKEQLQRMAAGMTGKLDELYPEVLGARNGWLGGDGDGWERGPYWVDGLLPLAYILNDSTLKTKANKWVEWTLSNQTAEGYIGPIPFEEPPSYEEGLQRGKREDWWPKMVMLKILQQYYSATRDHRVLEVLTKYFQYQLKELPEQPLDHLTFWANRRGGDNLQVVYWLYNITGDKFLLELGELIEQQTFPWTSVFLNDRNPTNPMNPWAYASMKRYPFDTAEINSTSLSQVGGIHTVNLAQGLKQPALLFHRTGDYKYINATKKALFDINRYHGQVQGMYGGDEPLHGTNPIQGIEFCSISEKMYSLETIIKITGHMEYADLLERITYNALPAQSSDDYMSRQYFQAANQVSLKENVGPSFENNNHRGTDFVFGLFTGYPCCTTNMHQSWPKFVQNLFYATSTGAVAAIQYAPSTVDLLVGDSIPLTIKETTGYPFRDRIRFTLSLENEARFPFHLRIPEWSKDASISINGENIEFETVKQVAILNQTWKNEDVIELHLPMNISTSTWHEFTTAIERGLLVYALGVKGKEVIKTGTDRYGTFSEFHAEEPWNYGLLKSELEAIPSSIEVVENNWDGEFPWNLEKAPISLKLNALYLPEWTAESGIPHLPAFWGNYAADTSKRIQQISLVPYGCTTLRISQFPTYKVP